MVEVPIACVQGQPVLQDEGSDPDVVGRDGGALPAELTIHRGVLLGRLIVGEERVDLGLGEKQTQDPLVFGSALAHGKTSPKLGQDNERQVNRVRLLQQVDGSLLAAAESHVSVGVEGNSHFQSASSILSCSAIA